MEKTNKLIAEFMGGYTPYERFGNSTEYYYNGGYVYLNDMHFHTSWDWLMPVLKKINLQLNPDNYNEWRMINRPTEYDIENVYAQAVYFITNQNN
mgnify:FL=1|tara:strand:- start:793 stop:1077 length:285 start_codon:yes stop_codon:yes gene_type:complete